MTLSAILGNALAGLQVQQTRLAATSNNIANRDTPDYRRFETELMTSRAGGVFARVEQAGAPGQPDEIADMTDMIESSASFSANARAFETGADLWAMLLSIKRD